MIHKNIILDIILLINNINSDFQVAPAELEALLLQHKEIADAGVVGLPNEEAGELPLAFIVTQPNSKVTEKEIVEFVASKVGCVIFVTGDVMYLVTTIPYQISFNDKVKSTLLLSGVSSETPSRWSGISQGYT